MRGSFRIITPFLLVLCLSNCVPVSFTSPTLSTETQFPVATATQTKSTPMPISQNTKTLSITSTSPPTQTATKTFSPPTLEPGQASERILEFLQNDDSCPRPCFLGIIAEQTTYSEAKTILSQLGLRLEGPEPIDKGILYGTSIGFNSGLHVRIRLIISDEIVSDIEISIIPEMQRAGAPREWLIYSPEILMRSYGQPSRVDILLGRVAPHPALDLVLYFNEFDTIIEYYKSDSGVYNEICPIHDQFASVRLWIGKNPLHPPFSGEPLEKTTDLTLESFSQLMTGDPEQACFTYNPDSFP